MIKFKTVTLQSSKYVVVREEGAANLAIIDTATKNVLRLPVQVDSAIMNPVSKVVALRAGNNLQIYNLEMKTKMKTTQMDEVVFWKWLDPKTVAVVTEKSCYHWSMEGAAEPRKMFDRAPYEGAVQIINYSASNDGKWLLLGGIASAGGGIVGVLQVFSVDVGASQPTMDSHAACFSHITLDGRDKPSTLFCFTKMTPNGGSVNIIEVGVPREQAFKMQGQLQIASPDFPVSLLADDTLGVLFLISKTGLLSVYDIQSGKTIFAQKASKVTMFASCVNEEGGISAIDQTGRMSWFYVDKQNIVPYICSQLNDYDLGVQMAKRYNLPGAESIFQQQFYRLMQSGRVADAIELAISSPQGVLRNAETINAFKNAPVNAGEQSPLLQYFSALLKTGTLNRVESLEMVRPILAKKSPQGLKYIEDWLKENKLECSEELGDLLQQSDLNLALSVYVRAKVHEKVVRCFMALGAKAPDDASALAQFEKVFRYSKSVSYQPDYITLTAQLIRVKIERAKDFALMLLRSEDVGPSVDVRTLVRIFMQANDVKNTTNILLEYLKPRGDRDEDADLQTMLLEINLMAMPQVADAIMESEEFNFSKYDRLKIAQLCERSGLYQRALEHYTDLADIKRVLTNAAAINMEFLLEYFGQMTPENCLDILRDLLKFNMQQNIRLVVEVAKKWSDYLTPEKLIKMFEDFNSYNGLYYYLGGFINQTQDKAVAFKYIQAAVKLNQVKEVERVCRDNDNFDPIKVKEFLLEQNLNDPRPLIYVCDRFDFIDELTRYLYNGGKFPFIEAYVMRMNVKAAPAVIGTLLDLNASEDQIRTLVINLRPPVDDPAFIERLVANVEKRNRLKLLKDWLEGRANEGNTDVNLHNALGKIYVDLNLQPQRFLTENKYYDSKEVGKFCESRDPHLAVVAYRRANGACDKELINVTNQHGFFKDQARYLVHRQDPELWATVLVEENQYRRQLIDQVVATALPETKVSEEVVSTVKAFMAAKNLQKELLELLERIVLHSPPDDPFRKLATLQNLLILTAMKHDKKRVMDYLNRLDNYSGAEIARVAVSEQYAMYEEAFFIYKKFKMGPEAISVLVDNIKSIERAVEFAEYWNKPETWTILGKAQLDDDRTKDAITSFIKADDPSHFEEVIQSAKHYDLYVELIAFIKMARKKLKETLLDNELIYAYAKTKRLADMEEFIAQPNLAKLEAVGDQCYAEGLYEAGRILFNNIGNSAKLALCLVKLELYSEAVDAARKANAIPTWKSVCYSCVDAQKFRLAQICALNLIVYNEHLLELCKYYETRGHFEELQLVLEQGINLDRAHQGIYTQLGVVYSRYKEEKLMEHIKLFWSRLNIPTLLQACRESQHWKECVFLYSHYDQFDNAVDVLIYHSTECWTPESFKEVLGKVTNTEVLYKAIEFYLEEHPLMLSDLLLDLAAKIDHNRVVHLLRNHGQLPLAQKYLLHVQRENLIAVNEAVNELFLQDEDFKSLRESIDNYTNFDQIALAQRIESHELLEFRRISAYVYKRNERYDKSIELSKRDEMWGDSMETAATSKNADLVESLLRFFVERKLNECYAACLFVCYELIRPDVVLETAWRMNLMEFAMPFMVQTMYEMNDKVSTLYNKLEEEKRKREADEEAKKKSTSQDRSADASPYGPGLSAPLALMPPPGMMVGVGPMMAPPPAFGMPPMGSAPMGGPGYYPPQY